MATLPTGTVTFLFTDIEGSTQLLHQLSDRYANVLAQHHQLLRAALETYHGQEVDNQGDAFFAVFARAGDAVSAAVAAQRALAAHTWPEEGQVRVRIGLHTGEPTRTDSGYVGMDVHRGARIMAAGHGGQILLSHTTRDLVENNLPPGVALHTLGEHRLKDLQQPTPIFQLEIKDLPNDFPPLNTLSRRPHNLPVQLTSFIGRESAIQEVKHLLSSIRLLTLTGAGGCGKTRLSLQVGAEVLEDYDDGVWLVELAPVADPALIVQTVASTLGIREQGARPLLETLIDYLKPKTLLLLLDNCEHLLEGCAQLAHALLKSCPTLKILASSREGLGVAGEQTYRAPSLTRPDPKLVATLPLEQLTQYEAVRLFIDRAVLTSPHFSVTNQNAPAVAEICHRLDGIPLAIELAAARVKAMSVEQISTRLTDRFRLLTGGSRTALPRQQTLRALIDWSYDLLSDKEKLLLARLSVFAGGWTLEAAEKVCSDDAVIELKPEA
ncbi:MAG: adenylate/guanylate cyclase domain-containing protein [Abitibacteriaceae bacterium]|nr:adenylate/guanylate cyclase domain-containing protein [Abditibacteriaceae bacterium]